jgi:quinol-cytochrome oxidoreductase complex cytochrome b subunit
MRQMHHWAAMLFIASMMVHMMRVYFTGAFRKPRELNWVIGCLLLLLGTLEGFTGYSLPDDLLSGTGIRAADGFVKSIPVSPRAPSSPRRTSGISRSRADQSDRSRPTPERARA